VTFISEKPVEECGVFGISGFEPLPAAYETYLGLYALQHRGQTSCGISVREPTGDIYCSKGMGTVPEVFCEAVMDEFIRAHPGCCAIGHVRYSPATDAQQDSTQPFVMRYAKGSISVANNGCLVNAVTLRRDLETKGSIFQTDSDAELIGHLIARQRLVKDTLEQAVQAAMPLMNGAYSCVVMSRSKLIAFRDPLGMKPLCLGRLGNAFIIASESCAISSLGGELVRDVEPGEILVIGRQGIESIPAPHSAKGAFCVFEYVYFARPDSVINGLGVHKARFNAGRQLAVEEPAQADIVAGIPDSGINAALGYAFESGIRFADGFVKNRYVGRTFIESDQIEREKAVAIKLNPLSAEVRGKRVILIDDSIVRGTTSAHIVENLRRAGAKEVHMRISSPPFLFACPYGTDISHDDLLLARNLSTEQIRCQIGADSLGYLSIRGLRKAARCSQGTCDACFTGHYPVQTGNGGDKFGEKLKKL